MTKAVRSTASRLSNSADWVNEAVIFVELIFPGEQWMSGHVAMLSLDAWI